MAKRGERRINWGLIIILIIVAFIVLIASSCTILIFAEGPLPSGNVALINIHGTISVEGESFLGEQGTSSNDVADYIETAEQDDSIKAILLDINSGGGSAVASKEIADAVKKAEKPCYAVIREIGTSGAYWIASACDTVIASEMSFTGSISAIASYLEVSGLLERYNITYERLVSGPYKDIGSPLKELTSPERAIIEKMLAKIHNYFVEDVAENRNLPVEHVRQLATGEFYLGTEALELGLVDNLGDMDTAIEMIKEDLDVEEVDLAEYEAGKTFLELMMGAFSEQFFHVGRGIGYSLVNSRAINRIEFIT